MSFTIVITPPSATPPAAALPAAPPPTPRPSHVFCQALNQDEISWKELDKMLSKLMDDIKPISLQKDVPRHDPGYDKSHEMFLLFCDVHMKGFQSCFRLLAPAEGKPSLNHYFEAAKNFKSLVRRAKAFQPEFAQAIDLMGFTSQRIEEIALEMLFGLPRKKENTPIATRMIWIQYNVLFFYSHIFPNTELSFFANTSFPDHQVSLLEEIISAQQAISDRSNPMHQELVGWEYLLTELSQAKLNEEGRAKLLARIKYCAKDHSITYTPSPALTRRVFTLKVPQPPKLPQALVEIPDSKNMGN